MTVTTILLLNSGKTLKHIHMHVHTHTYTHMRTHARTHAHIPTLITETLSIQVHTIKNDLLTTLLNIIMQLMLLAPMYLG